METFGINIPIFARTPYLLYPVPDLQYLDMPHSYVYTGHGPMIKILQSLKITGYRLKAMNLSSVQGNHGTQPRLQILLRDQIYVNIQNSPVRILELLYNEVVALQAGLTTYLPQAEVIRVGSTRLLYVIGSQECYYTDILLHPVLRDMRELVISYPLVPTIPHYNTKRSVLQSHSISVTKSRLATLVNTTVLQHGNILCAVANFLCAGEVTFPCNRIRNVTLAEILDFSHGCYADILFPLPPRLERVSLLNIIALETANDAVSEIVFRHSHGEVVKICFLAQKNRKYFDASYQIPKAWFVRSKTRSQRNWTTKCRIL